MLIAILAPPYKETVGGGYTYIEALLTALTKRKSSLWEYEVIDFEELEQRAVRNLALWQAEKALVQQWLERPLLRRIADFCLRHDPPHAFRERRSQRRPAITVDDVLNEELSGRGVDLLWLIAPFSVIKPDKPYVVTVWDLAHRVYPFFPEVSNSGWKWEARETYYREMLPKASWIITGSSRGADEISVSYGILRERIKLLPLPTPTFDGGDAFVLPSQRDFLFYPANFWAHKNHATLIEALKVVRDRYQLDIDLVLTGSDPGNGLHVRSLVSSDLKEHVHFLGFVPRPKIAEIYRSAKALIYLSFFGPDNLPPLEAFLLETPVIASDHPGHREQLGEAALFVDPTNAAEIARGIYQTLTDSSLRSRLIENGRLIARSRSLDNYVVRLEGIWSDFATYRRCWAQ